MKNHNHIPDTIVFNERKVSLGLLYQLSEGVFEPCKGFSIIKVGKESVHFYWHSDYKGVDMNQKSFSRSDIAENHNPFAYMLTQVIDDIENYCVKGRPLYKVENWSWVDAYNPDQELVKKIIKHLEIMRKRPRLYIKTPEDIEVFEHGFDAATISFGLTIDVKIAKLTFGELGIDYSKEEYATLKYDWEYIDKRLQAIISAWKLTYGIE